MLLVISVLLRLASLTECAISLVVAACSSTADAMELGDLVDDDEDPGDRVDR